MKKIFGYRSEKGKSPLDSSIGLGRNRGHRRTSFQPGYHIRDRDLKKIHKAASVGNVAKVKQILWLGKNGLNDRDKKNRTALHLACANGHSEVVALLLERKCQLNLCDSEYKTALMKAIECQEEECATLLLEHGADPNVTDVDGNTALHYAVFCQNVSLAAKLLSYNANIEARNEDDLTPLLLGISERKQQMVEFLVKKEADIHAVDNMKRTALILAVNYECADVVSLLLQRGADVSSQDVLGLTAEEYAAISGFNIICELISEYKEKRPKTTPENSNPAAKSSEEDSLSRFSNKPGVDSQPTSDDDVLGSEIKKEPKSKLAKLMKAFQQSKRNQAECGIVRRESATLSENNNSDSKIEDVVETLPKPSPGVQGFSHPAFPRPDPLPKSLKTLAGLGLAKEGTTKPELVENESDADIIERAPQEQANHDHLTSVDRAHKNNRSDMMSAIGLGEEKDTESPRISESISETIPQNSVCHLPEDQRGKNTLNGQVEASPEKCPNVKPAVRVKDSVPNKTVRMKKPQTSNSDFSDWDSTSLSFNSEICQRARHLKGDDQRPLASQSMTKNQLAPTELGQKTVADKEKMKNAAVFLVGNSMPHHPCQSPLPGNRGSKEDFSDWDSTSLSLNSETCQRARHLKGDDQRPLAFQSVTKNQSAPTELGQKTVTDKEKMKNAAVFLVGNSMPHHPCQSPLPGNRGSKEDLSGELDLEVILEGEQEKPDGDENNHTQVEEEKKHKDAADESRLIQQRKSGGNNKQTFPAMENKGSDSSDPGVHRKGVKKKHADKRTPEGRVIAPIFEKTNSLTGGLLHVNGDSILREVDQGDGRPARKTAYEKKKVSHSGRKAKGLLRKNHMQDEIALPRLEIDTVNNQNQEKEKKCFEGIEIVKGENDYPQEAIKLNKEMLTKAIFQHTGQLKVPIAENTMLNPELENAKQSKQRLETEVESYCSRLAPATHDHDQGQTSQRDLELASQKAKDKRLRLQDQMKFYMANLKSDNEMLSQQLSKVKNKFDQLKIKLHQTTDDLREKTLMLERVQRDLCQAQCQKQVIEHMFNEQCKVNEYLGKQESLEERLSQLQSENMLLRQQLDDAQNRANSNEKIVISIRDQFQQILRKLQAEREKQGLMLEERNKELINRWKHVQERMRQYENEKAEGEALVRHLQQELSDTFKKQSELAESLDVMSYHRAKLEVEAQDLKSNLHQLTSQLQETQDQRTEAVRCAEKTQDHIQKLKMENTELQTTVKKQVGRIKQLQGNLLSIRLTDDLPAKLETVCSTCLHMNAKIQVLQEEFLSMKEMQKRCEKLEKNKKKLEQEVVNLKSHIELNMIEHSQVEHYKQEVEERVRQDLIEKLREVNMVLQMQEELDRSITRELEEGCHKAPTLGSLHHTANSKKTHVAQCSLQHHLQQPGHGSALDATTGGCSVSTHGTSSPSKSIGQAGSHQELGFEEPGARPLQETPSKQEKPDYAQGKGVRRFKRKHLTAIECQHLARSHLAASQSFQRWTSRDPNHGLYPRPRTKRGARGRGCLRYSLDFFLAGQQQCTNDMAKSNSVGQGSSEDSEDETIFAAGSPCALPPGGDGEARLHSSGSTLPARKRSRSLEDERNPAPGTSPWDGVSKKTPWHHSSPSCTRPREARPEAEVGVGQLTVQPGEPGQEAEDIGPDPVPDSHYGLLGTLPCQEPLSHICSLPSEVLRHIFAFLPVEDLYWNLSLVCRLWREVISDPLFIPWKKLYHRYLMNEEQAVSKVDGILSSYGIEKESDLCVLNLIRYTATTKCSPSVDPGQALWSLRDHLLLPEAEACVRQHLPDLCAAPAGVNVWALVAAIVLLSSSVSDIQQLLFCLRRPSSTVTVPDVTETLYCIAVLLYAMREKGISISNRIHYNIFYCLYLQENSCAQASGDKEEPSVWPGKKTTIQLTHEQQLILSHKMEPLQVVKIMAFAGTGKTSTLVKYAEKWSQSRFLYVTFNKSIAKQAERVFPSNVICKTFHSMAYGHIGRKYQLKKKLNLFKLTPFMVNSVLTEGKGGFIRAKLVCKTLENFFASADEELTIDHVPIWCKNTQGQRVMVEQSEKLNGVLEASRLWDNMRKLGECREEAYHMTHDGYLKLWQLSKPLLASFDAIFVDEAQDCTPAIMNIVLSQPCGKIFVGDPHQQIYTFRGAVNALFTVPHTHVFYLTQSFRFGVEIAYVGATILDVCKRVRRKTLVGGNHQSGIRGDSKGQVALLSRTNANVFDEAVRVTEGEVPARIHLIGGIKSFGLDRIIDIWTLLQPEEERKKRNLVIKDKFIRRWAHKEGFSGFKRYVTAAEDKELEAKIAVVEKYNIRIPELVARIERCHIEDLDFAEYILGTVHKAKGLEFDTVHVLDDFVKVPCARHNLAQLPHFRVESFSEDEWNLLYVAVTRAKKQLIMTRSLENILTLAGEYFLQAELTSNVLKTGVVRCCVGQCSNAIPVDAALTMRKLPITYSNRKENKGGYLCHSCVEQRIGPLTFLTASPEQVRAMVRTVENVVLPRHEALLFLVF